MFQCKDLLQLSTMKKAKTIAGKKGLDNQIRWAYKAENMNISNWVRGQELLIISTPVIVRDDFNLEKLIETAISQNLSGALLLVGNNYVESIKESVIKLADNNNFPLICIPWDIPLVDIFEEMGHAISYHDTMDGEQENLLSNIILGNHINIAALKMKAEIMGYNLTPPQQIFVINFFNKTTEDISNTIPREIVNDIIGKLNDLFKEHGYLPLISAYSNKIVGLMGAPYKNHKKRLEIIFSTFVEYLYSLMNIGCYIGVGSKIYDLSNLRQSFKEASNCVTVAEIQKKEALITWYDNLGFFKILLSFENTETLEKYRDEVLGKLIDYDQTNSTSLVDTLSVYFQCNNNIGATSEKMFTHRNTIKYRIHRIQEIIGRDFHNSNDLLELHNAILINSFLNIS